MGNKDIRDAFFDEIYELAAKDKDIIFITADADAHSLKKFRSDYPQQFINIGVAEQNMVCVAAGLALSGKKVFIYAIIPFIILRCFEHIKVNICSMNLPVTIIGAGAGLSFGYDGPTHHAVTDIAVMRTLPEVMILNPADSNSSKAASRIAYEAKTPVYVRLDKGNYPEIYSGNDDFSKGFKVVKAGSDVCIISTGFMTAKAMDISEKLKKQAVDCGVVDLFRLKPINAKMLIEAVEGAKLIVTYEENSIVGGLGSAVSEIFSDCGITIQLKRIALSDSQHFEYGTRDWLHTFYEIDHKTVLNLILDKVKIK